MAKQNIGKAHNSESFLEEKLQETINAELKARTAYAKNYVEALKKHNELFEELIEKWKENRDDEKKTRKRFAIGILSFAVIQSVAVYFYIIYRFAVNDATSLEAIGMASLICSQTFGLVFVVVKYFFSQKPEGLIDIMRFVNKTSPDIPLSSILSSKSNERN